MEGWKPSFIVAIDFGMTCTAVAYSSAPEWVDPKCIQRWPGRFHESELANKVLTQLGYGPDDVGVVSWGFKCKYDDTDGRLEKEFKLYLDPEFVDAHPGRPSHADAVRLYTDYMRCLYDHLDYFFKQSTPNWDDRNVEYLFSIPTTWKNPRLTAQLEQWLADAGFVNNHRRRVKISQTEAEAAAVYAAKQSFSVGDIVMVADAGGSTTDINILELREHNSERTLLKALNKAEGINVGSTLIDWEVKELIKSRLYAMNLPGDEETIHFTAEDMMEDCGFEDVKCAFDGRQMHLNTYMRVPVSALGPGSRSRNTQVIVTAAELKTLFDAQTRIMFDKIDQQLSELAREMPRRSPKYLVLSGGLGSSKYVQRELTAKYSQLNVLCAPEPQLAVAKGLIMDRVQALRRGVGVYTGKCSRVSYGVLCRQPYDPIQHRGEKVNKDPLDGMIWAEEMIDWLVKEGEAVPDEGFLRSYRLKIPKGSERDSFKAQIVRSESPASNLPKSLRAENVSKLCTAIAHFHEDQFASGSGSSYMKPFKEKKGGIFSRSQGHYIAEFDLKVVIGSADLRFELVAKDGRKFNQNQARVDVQWEEASIRPPTALDPNAGGRDIYPVAERRRARRP